MSSPAKALELSARAVEKGPPRVIANSPEPRSLSQPVEASDGRSDQHRLSAEVPSATSNPGVLGPSLQRLYDPEGAPPTGPSVVSPARHTNSFDATLDLTTSLLESVFEISEFDPLPHLNYREDEFGFDFLAGSPHYPASTKPLPAKNGDIELAPLDGRQNNWSTPADGLSGMDRRKLPRRESECIVSVCRCRSEQRPTAERIAWMLHATKLKGQLIDVSMSGVAFHIMESLTAGSRILLRISNRTIDKQVDTSAVILRSRAASDGGWDLVCRFHKNLTFEQIHTVGRSLFAATIV